MWHDRGGFAARISHSVDRGILADVILSARLPVNPNIPRALAALVMVGLLSLMATRIVHGSVVSAVGVIMLVLSPFIIWLSLRLPMLFPFGLYIALASFDPLLRVSGGAGTLTKVFGIATIFALVARTLLARRSVVPPLSWFAWLGVILYAGFSLAWSLNVDQTRLLLGQMLSLFALFTALAIYPIEYFELLQVRRLMILAGIVTGGYGVYAARSAPHVASSLHHGYERLMITSGKIVFDPNHFAAFFMIPISIVVVGFLCDPRPLHKVSYAAVFVLLSVNVLLSGSRGGLIGAALIIFYLGWRARKYILTGVIAAAGLAISAFIPTVWARFADPSQGGGSGRNEIWSTGLHAVREYWLAGSGFGTYPDIYDNYVLQSTQRSFDGWHRPSHSLIIESIVEFGVLGSIVLFSAIWSSLRQNASIARTHPLFTYRLESEGMLVGVLWMALTIDVLWYKYLWLALSFAILLANVHRSRTLLGNAGMSAMQRPSAETLRRPRARVSSAPL